jgi:hypothetical protein
MRILPGPPHTVRFWSPGHLRQWLGLFIAAAWCRVRGEIAADFLITVGAWTVPLEYLVAQLDAADSRYMKVYSRSVVAVVIPVSVVIPVPAGVHVHIAPIRAGSAVAVVIPISVVAPLRAVHPAIAVDADFAATPLRAGRARKQHRGNQGRGCSK